jgi:hypothetical protein
MAWVTISSGAPDAIFGSAGAERACSEFWMLDHSGTAARRPAAPRERQTRTAAPSNASCAQVRQVSAVGAKDESHLVFAESQIVEQEIARSIAQHLVQSRPR